MTNIITGKLNFASNKLVTLAMPKTRNLDTLLLDGGALCFHFINTVYAWRGPNLHEYLDSYASVLKWCKKVNILEPAKRASLLRESKVYPLKAGNALEELKKMRELLYNFFSALAAHDEEHLAGGIMARFNATLSNAFSHLGFTIKQKQLALEWNNAGNDLLEPAWIVMKSAYDIITTEDHSRIKECPKCGWIFIDKTKNNKRRWCNPSFCGSTEKSKKYYQKVRSTRAV